MADSVFSHAFGGAVCAVSEVGSVTHWAHVL